jgi:hypothetical protein
VRVGDTGVPVEPAGRRHRVGGVAVTAIALQRWTLSISTGRAASAPNAVRTRSTHCCGEMSWPTWVSRRPSGSSVAKTARKPESPVIENRKNPVSPGLLTYTTLRLRSRIRSLISARK